MIETFANRYPDRDYEIAIMYPEFTCLSVVTGQPAFGEIRIIYVPDHACIELKALKLYLHRYRCEDTSPECAVKAILGDLIDACRPRRMEVIGTFKPTGDVKKTVTVTYP